jgi:ribonucleoside-diphosphate reductase alpha chain
VIVEERYTLPDKFKLELAERPVQWGFGTLSEAVYMRTYSRDLGDGQETWADTICRVVEGVMSIRIDWLKKAGKRVPNYDKFAQELALAMYEMKMLPPGRGLWAMGTQYIYDRGSHALNNCAYVDVTTELSSSAAWLMDALMCGVGVGFGTQNASLKPLKRPDGEARVYKVPDTKEGWAESVRRLIKSYERGGRPWEFDYSQIRRKGAPIRGFGGVSAGAAPLRTLHSRLRKYLSSSSEQTRLIADVMNAIGACVVAGNVRRSAEIAIGSPYDDKFLELKNYERYPERQEIGWMSNNSIALRESDDFVHVLGNGTHIGERIADNGEPGILNLLNVQKYGRYGERSDDDAVGVNPCGEIPLESHELCNLVEVFPTRCDPSELNRVLELATFYASTVALLQSHSEETNEVVARNRRIGVSVSGIADWLDSTSTAQVYDALNHGYDVVRATNRTLAKQAGVPESIRVTTVKPSGTVSLLAGVSSGMHHPLSGYVLRRVRVAQDSPISERLVAAGIPHEPDVASENTEVFEFPLRYGQGRTRSVKSVSVWEQAAIVAMLQKAWADNAVSNTLTVQPAELGQVDRVLAVFAGQVKSMSMLPDRSDVYEQMPLEHLSKEQFEDRSAALKAPDWTGVKGSDGDAQGEAYCQGDYCEIPQR